MPELAEVAYYARQWQAGKGQEIQQVAIHPNARVFRDLGHPAKGLPKKLEGQCLDESRTHGKQMFLRFGEVWLCGHLGMSGQLSVYAADHRLEKHDHLALRQARQTLVYTDPRMFGRWRLFENDAMTAFWDQLPPEVTDERFTLQRLRQHLERRRRRPLKALLLEQEVFPGIGNWMADEVLWRCQLDPRRLAGDLNSEETALLRNKLRLVCRQALRLIGTRWGTPPKKTWLFQHRWTDGGRCPCGAPLVREQVSGRTTCWCPTCQER